MENYIISQKVICNAVIRGPSYMSIAVTNVQKKRKKCFCLIYILGFHCQSRVYPLHKKDRKGCCIVIMYTIAGC